MKKLTKIEFIKKSIQKHGNFYDYSISEYINQNIKLKIICPKHGIFEQRPDHHLKGHKCKKCSVQSEIHLKNRKLEYINFLNNAIKVHGIKYDYSKVEYKSAKTKIIIICSKHGNFMQTPDNHLQGKECLKCSNEKNAFNQTKTLSEFIKESIKIHGNAYSYVNSKYIHNKEKIEIICPTHGSFFQMPYNHLQGKGCKLCSNKSKKEEIIESILKSKNINYVREKTFDCCVNPKTKTKLRFDFYLPEHNLCIEYDGKQHFEPIKIWGGDKALQQNKYKDSIKNKFCKSNNVKLIRINYKQNLIRKLNTLFPCS